MLLCAMAVAAPNEADIKTAFIYNFAKFVEWPRSALPADDALQICADAHSLEGRLGMLQGREAQGHIIHIRTLSASDPVTGCNMLVLGDTPDSGHLIHSLEGRPVLTVSDSPGFAEHGGMIGLFIESNHVQFAVNREVAEQSGLKLSARMLQVARIVQSEAR